MDFFACLRVWELKQANLMTIINIFSHSSLSSPPPPLSIGSSLIFFLAASLTASWHVPGFPSPSVSFTSYNCYNLLQQESFHCDKKVKLSPIFKKMLSEVSSEGNKTFSLLCLMLSNPIFGDVMMINSSVISTSSNFL